ncbi:MAG: AAA family ATPase [Chloroflexota bacterium]|nr:AAA family ATPase [Chloroflexota bacterium]
MIVEFIGSTGAGKTSLISKIHQQLAQTKVVTTPFDLIAAQLGLSSVTHPTAQNLIQELVGFPFFVGSLSRHGKFLSHTIETFSRNTKFSIHRINNFRSLERKIGMYELTQRYDKGQIILVDEGPILAAHMFVFTGSIVTSAEIAAFANLLPLPDLVVYIKAPVEVLVRRALQRPDPPREMGEKDPIMTEKYVKDATAVFDQLMESERIKSRLLVVDNPDLTTEEHEKLAAGVTAAILNYESLGSKMNKI